MKPPFRVERIDHVVFRVADLERSIQFWQQVLGCEVARRRDDLGLVHLRAGTAMVDLVALDGPLGRKGGAGPAAEGRNVDHLCLRVEPFEEELLAAHLRALGVPHELPSRQRFGAEGEGPSLYLTDPDGNVVELKGSV